MRMFGVAVVTCFLLMTCALPAYAVPEEGPLPAPHQRLKAVDVNGDDQVTFEELRMTFPNVTQERFTSLDRNGDGVLTSADGTARRQGPRRRPMVDAAKRADTNGDGKVTFEELSAVQPDITQERFARMDRNGDGALTMEDLPKHPGQGDKPHLVQKLQEADTDGNGQVTFEELSAIAPNMTQERFARLDRNGDGALTQADVPQGPRPGHRPPIGDMIAKIRQADADGDGKVTLAEIQAQRPDFPQAAFDRLDRNGDGVLTKDDAPGGIVRDRRPPLHMLADRLKQADADGDGKVTLDEIRAKRPDFPQQAFERMDRNSDGYLSPEDHRGN